MSSDKPPPVDMVAESLKEVARWVSDGGYILSVLDRDETFSDRTRNWLYSSSSVIQTAF